MAEQSPKIQRPERVERKDLPQVVELWITDVLAGAPELRQRPLEPPRRDESRPHSPPHCTVTVPLMPGWFVH